MKTLKYITYTLIVFIVSYLLAVVLLPHVTIKPELVDHVRNVNIYIKSNGIHTDIVVPIKNSCYNWTQHIHQKHIIKPSTEYEFIAIGWGDKGFYLNTPTWNDLTMKTATKATLGLSGTAIHITYYKKILENEKCVKLSLTETQYIALCDYIKESTKITNKGTFIPIKTNANYGDTDAFYEAKGSYSLFKTCNTWTNTGLKKCGQKACLWTVLPNQILTKNK